MKHRYLRCESFSRLTWGLVLTGLLVFGGPVFGAEIQVDSADPSSAEQGTYDLEVTVTGDNFGADSEVDFFVVDTSDPGGIKVKKVKRQGPKTLKVTIDVAPDAQTELDFDIRVRSRGRTGKGTELFRVLKKEKLPEPQWEVQIPLCGERSDLNLCGRYQTTYVETSDEDGVAVDVGSFRDRKTGLQMSKFTLVVFMCNWGGGCIGSYEHHQITLQNFEFRDFGLGEGPECVFPELSMSECSPVGPPQCLECFVNGEHPYSNDWPWPMGDGDDYTWIYFRVIVPESFEDIQDGGSVQSSGELEMMLRGQHQYLATGDEGNHFVRTDMDLPGDAVSITRDGNSWTVDVTVPPPVRFFEGYRGCVTRNPKGKCVGNWDYVYPLWADIAEPLHFTATWTRTYP